MAAYYPFDGTADDKSGNGNNVMVYGATLTDDRFGNADSAYDFDGGDNYIQTPVDSNSLPLSFSVWFYAGSVSGERSIVDSDVSGLGGHSLIIDYLSADDQLDVERHGFGGHLDTTFAVSDGQWYHAVVVYSDTNTIKLYVDGVLALDDSYTPSGAPDGSNFRFGKHNAFRPAMVRRQDRRRDFL